ncbi:RmlC-like cupin domain-containing protein [Aspergillus aurantiobrunneus]
MTLFTTAPPSTRTPYAIPQLEGERITIPGSKGTFRILASSKQTNGLMAVFQSGAVLSDAPGFHYHNHAHDVFLVTKGFLKLWNGDKCRIMGPGDFAYVPPGVIHNPEMLGPHTEIYGLITPGDWVDFFRYISEPYEGVLVPENDPRDLKSILVPKVMAAKGQFDVVFQPEYVPPPLSEWDGDDENLPAGPAPFFLKANTGPRWMLGGVLSRPFVTTAQSGGVCAISSIESSGDYGGRESVLGRFMAFERVDHCLAVLEGTLGVRVRGDEGAVEVFREGETVVIPAGRAFALEFRSRYVRVWSFTDGDGIEALVQRAGREFGGVVLPERVTVEKETVDEEVVQRSPSRIIRVNCVDGSCHVNPPPRVPRSSLARSVLALPRPATGAGPRSTSAMSSTRARIARKVEELSSKLQAAGSKLSPRQQETLAISATPCSMPPEKPTLTPTSRHELEEPTSYEAEAEPPDEPGDPIEDEITEVNHHTNGIEFHGSTSSVALLGHLQKARDPQPEAQWPSARALKYSIVSTLHNASFSPTNGAAQSLATVHEHNYYFEQAHVFMSGYFENIHFIHPFIDKEDFYLRAHDLWMRRTPTPDPSFIALYLSVLSFGALLRVWDEAQLGGLTRFEWSRKLFGEAQVYMNYLHFPNNLDAVQCLYLMVLAYMYLGLAVRTCLAAGFNRNVRPSSDPRAEWISRTWWGLFSLEIEMSFSLGRPDTLGLDDYHNRPLPLRDDSLYAIIPWMVDFAHITRKVSVQIYHRRLTLQEKLAVALGIETELDSWMAQLPDRLRPDFIPGGGRNDLKDPKWARRQRLVLGIRYYNVKTLLFRPFLRYSTGLGNRPRSRAGERSAAETEADADTSHSIATQLGQTISKCLDAAQNTISVIHDIYRVHTFFRCWWYNTTYVTFATSTLLLYLSHSLSSASKHKELVRDPTPSAITPSIEQAIEILEATDESVVTRKCAELIRYYLREFQARGGESHERSRGLRDGGPVSVPVVGDESSTTWAGVQADANVEGSGHGYPGGGEFDVPEWAYGFGFPDCSFEGIARFFDDLGGLPILEE